MSIFDSFSQTGVAEFSYPKDVVFKAVQEAAGLVKGMKVDSASEASGTIQIKVGMSAFSWGENVDLSVVSVGPWSAQVRVTSSAKVGFNATASGKNKKNFRELITAISDVLTRNGDAWANQMGLDRPASDASPQSGSSFEVADELRKLADLRESGLLTDDEFAQRKARLLDS